MLRWRLFSLGALVLASVALAVTPLINAQERAASGYLRVIHASPDAPPVDIWVDGSPAIQALAYGQYTGYLAVPAGQHAVVVTPAGQGADQAVIQATVQVESGQAYTAVALGKLAEIKAAVLQDERQHPAPTQTDARLRFMHAVPGAPAVDVVVGEGAPLFENVAFSEKAGYSTVKAGEAYLRVNLAGTGDTVLSVPDAMFTPDGVYTLIAIMGSDTSAPVKALWLSDK